MLNKVALFWFIALCLLSFSFAADWVMDGDTVYWESNGARITAYPAVSRDIIHQTQYVNFTYDRIIGMKANLSFVFDQPISHGAAYLWRNVSTLVETPVIGRVDYQSQFNDVSNIANTTADCQIGDSQNNIKRIITYGANASQTVVCFNSYSQSGNNYTAYYQLNGITDYNRYYQNVEKWDDISQLFIKTNVGGKTVFTVRNVDFTYGSNYQTKFEYDVPMGSSGKFDIYIHEGSPAQVAQGLADVLLVLDPWWNTSIPYKLPINITNWNCATGAYCTSNLTIDLNESATNGTDIRILNGAEDTLINFWRKDGWNTTTASGTIFLNASNATSQIYIYYGGNLSDASNFDHVFFSGDDFNSGTSVNTSRWFVVGTIPNNVINGVFNYSASYSAGNGFFFKTPAFNNSFRMWGEIVGYNGCSGDCRTGFGLNRSDAQTYRGIQHQQSDNTLLLPVASGVNGTWIHTAAAAPTPTNPAIFEMWSYDLSQTSPVVDARIRFANGTEYNFDTQAYQNVVKSPINAYIIPMKGAFDWIGAAETVVDSPIFTIGAQETYAPAAEPIVFSSQSPANLTSLNLFTGAWNATFNITVENPTDITFFHQVNSTLHSPLFFINGSPYNQGWIEGSQYNSSDGTAYTFGLYETEIYPATYNLNFSSTLTTPRTAHTLNNANSYAKVQLLNVSNDTQYGYYEIMANATSGFSSVYTCNSSYTTGNPATSTNCANIYSIPLNDTTNTHTHGTYSIHHTIPFPVINGSIAGVKITPAMQFLIRGQASEPTYVYYTSNISRTGAAQYTTNSGTTWSELSGTFDSHLHQFDNATTLYFYAQATNATATYNSTEQSDYIDLADIAPEPPTIITPKMTAHRAGTNITINYTAAVSPTNLAITTYKIDLYHINDTFAQTIVANNSPNLTYVWTTNSSHIGMYYIAINATDSAGLSSVDRGEEFLIYDYVVQFTNPIYDVNSDIVNLTISAGVYSGGVSANLTYGGDAYTGTCVVNSCSATVGPDIVETSTNISVNWSFIIYNTSLTQSNTTEVRPSGLNLCTGIFTTPSVVYDFKNAQTDATINATLSAVITFASGRSRSVESTNESITLCISPSDGSFNTTISETSSATGYSTTSTSRNIMATNASQSFTIYMYNASAVYSTQLKVVQTPAIAVQGATIDIYEYSGINYTYLISCTTSASGTCLVSLIANSQQYLYNITSGGETTTFGPEVVACDTTGLICYRTFTLGNTNYIPYIVEGNVVGSCTYTNATNSLSCAGNDTGSYVSGFNLTLVYMGNSTPICSQGIAGTSATLNCTVPNENNIFYFTFSAYDANGQYYLLSSGSIEDEYTFTDRWGTDGWLAAMILFIGATMAAVFSPWLGLLLGLFSIGISAVLGLIPADILPLMAGGVFIVALIGQKMRG